MRYDDTAAQQYELLRQVSNLATGVALAIRVARDLGLPVERGVKPGGEALVRWHAALSERLPDPPPAGGGPPLITRPHDWPPDKS